jgi:hypothetical protein
VPRHDMVRALELEPVLLRQGKCAVKRCVVVSRSSETASGALRSRGNAAAPPRPGRNPPHGKAQQHKAEREREGAGWERRGGKISQSHNARSSWRDSATRGSASPAPKGVRPGSTWRCLCGVTDHPVPCRPDRVLVVITLFSATPLSGSGTTRCRRRGSCVLTVVPRGISSSQFCPQPCGRTR